MNILIISPEPWDTNQVSKHHYARTLAKRGHKVFFLGPPDAACTGIVIKAVAGEIGDLWNVRAQRVASGLRFMPNILRRKLENRWLARLERQLGLKIDIVWLFENSRFYDMSFAGDRLKIYHQVDLNQNFHVASAAASADISFAVSDNILNRISAYAKEARKISHGVLSVKKGGVVELTKLRPGRRTAAYVGNLDIMYMDKDILREAIVASPEVDFHLIGSYSDSGECHRQLHQMPNVFFWGRLPSQDLPAVLGKLDVMMIVYDTIHYRDQVTNTHKLMEYMSTGKVIVATVTEEYKSLEGDMIAMVEEPREYVAMFRSVIADLDRWNSSELQAQRMAFASDNTYERQLDRISSALVESMAIRHRLGEVRL